MGGLWPDRQGNNIPMLLRPKWSKTALQYIRVTLLSFVEKQAVINYFFLDTQYLHQYCVSGPKSRSLKAFCTI